MSQDCLRWQTANNWGQSCGETLQMQHCSKLDRNAALAVHHTIDVCDALLRCTTVLHIGRIKPICRHVQSTHMWEANMLEACAQIILSRLRRVRRFTGKLPSCKDLTIHIASVQCCWFQTKPHHNAIAKHAIFQFHAGKRTEVHVAYCCTNVPSLQFPTKKLRERIPHAHNRCRTKAFCFTSCSLVWSVWMGYHTRLNCSNLQLVGRFSEPAKIARRFNIGTRRVFPENAREHYNKLNEEAQTSSYKTKRKYGNLPNFCLGSPFATCCTIDQTLSLLKRCKYSYFSIP